MSTFGTSRLTYALHFRTVVGMEGTAMEETGTFKGQQITVRWDGVRRISGGFAVPIQTTIHTGPYGYDENAEELWGAGFGAKVSRADLYTLARAEAARQARISAAIDADCPDW